jgi:hypothetical protein
VEKLTMAKDTDKTVAEMKTLIANLNKHIQHLNQALVRLKKRAGLPVDDDLLNGVRRGSISGAGAGFFVPRAELRNCS